jgi:hypothetical protein
MEHTLIEITRQESKVRIAFRKGPLDTEFYFYYDCGNNWYASLLRDHFDKKLRDTVIEIREEEYQRGYKDGRGKKAKTDWFSCLLKRAF